MTSDPKRYTGGCSAGLALRAAGRSARPLLLRRLPQGVGSAVPFTGQGGGRGFTGKPGSSIRKRRMAATRSQPLRRCRPRVRGRSASPTRTRSMPARSGDPSAFHPTFAIFTGGRPPGRHPPDFKVSTGCQGRAKVPQRGWIYGAEKNQAADLTIGRGLRSRTAAADSPARSGDDERCRPCR